MFIIDNNTIKEFNGKIIVGWKVILNVSPYIVWRAERKTTNPVFFNNRVSVPVNFLSQVAKPSAEPTMLAIIYIIDKSKSLRSNRISFDESKLVSIDTQGIARFIIMNNMVKGIGNNTSMLLTKLCTGDEFDVESPFDITTLIGKKIFNNYVRKFKQSLLKIGI